MVSSKSVLVLLQQLVTLLLLVGTTAAASDDASTEPYYTGKSIAGHTQVLDDKTFELAINDPANPFWLLKFYAPWYVLVV